MDDFEFTLVRRYGSEMVKVLGILLGFGIMVTIVTIASRFMPPVKSQIEKVI